MRCVQTEHCTVFEWIRIVQTIQKSRHLNNKNEYFSTNQNTCLFVHAVIGVNKLIVATDHLDNKFEPHAELVSSRTVFYHLQIVRKNGSVSLEKFDKFFGLLSANFIWWTSRKTSRCHRLTLCSSWIGNGITLEVDTKHNDYKLIKNQGAYGWLAKRLLKPVERCPLIDGRPGAIDGRILQD